MLRPTLMWVSVLDSVLCWVVKALTSPASREVQIFPMYGVNGKIMSACKLFLGSAFKRPTQFQANLQMSGFLG